MKHREQLIQNSDDELRNCIDQYKSKLAGKKQKITEILQSMKTVSSERD